MAAANFLVFPLFLALVISAAWVDASVSSDGNVDAPPSKILGSKDLDSSALNIELDLLTSKIYDLVSQIDKKTLELKAKDDQLAEKEKSIIEKADRITSLQNEVSSLQKKGKLDSPEELNMANARAFELEKKLDKLKENFEAQNAEKEALQTKASEADLKVDDVNSKLKDLQKISNEQKSKIEKTERALKVAEEEMMKARLEVTLRTKELNEVHGAWLPPWLGVQLIRFQRWVNKHWTDHGQPAVDLVYQKAQEKKAMAAKWAEPHLETVKTEAKKFSKPYIDQIATITEPHVNRVKVVVKPYTKKAVRAYGKFLESATTYHNQVQGTIQDTLERHKLTKLLATKELVWFAASASLALPILVAPRVWSTIFRKKAKRPSRSSHSRRKGKRAHIVK
ncbi:hypothetical protein LINPERPRIM_LOCUS40340 [Linum perenne]